MKTQKFRQHFPVGLQKIPGSFQYALDPVVVKENVTRHLREKIDELAKATEDGRKVLAQKAEALEWGNKFIETDEQRLKPDIEKSYQLTKEIEKLTAELHAVNKKIEKARAERNTVISKKPQLEKQIAEYKALIEKSTEDTAMAYMVLEKPGSLISGAIQMAIQERLMAVQRAELAGGMGTAIYHVYADSISEELRHVIYFPFNHADYQAYCLGLKGKITNLVSNWMHAILTAYAPDPKFIFENPSGGPDHPFELVLPAPRFSVSLQDPEKFIASEDIGYQPILHLGDHSKVQRQLVALGPNAFRALHNLKEGEL